MCTNTLRQGMKEREPDSSQWCSLTGQEVIGTNPKQEVRSEHEETQFLARMVKQQYGLPRETAESSSMETFKTLLNMVLGNPW